MYTGTLIKDLMATVQRAEQKTKLQQIAEQLAEQRELRAIFAMQIPIIDGDQIFMGAA